MTFEDFNQSCGMKMPKRFKMGFINEINEAGVRNARPTLEHADDKKYLIVTLR